MTCEPCRQQLLPYLYDLLEPLQREQTAAHLASCPDCQAALESAREQQGLLAEAVKEEHPGIVFKAPIMATPASSAPTIAMQRPRRNLFLLNRWAAAAAILLFLFGSGGAIGWSVWRSQADELQSANARLAKAKEDLAKSQHDLKQKKGQTQKDIRAIQKEIDALFDDWKTEETKTRANLDRQGASLVIKGPQVALAGAKNTYEVEWRQKDMLSNSMPAPPGFGKDASNGKKGLLQQQQMPAVQVRAYNPRTQETLYQQNLQLQPNNRANFDLPSNLPLKAGEDLALEFLLQAADGKLIALADNLKLVAPEYVTHLATDRPLYRPGDTVRFRSLTLERFSLKPAQEKFHLRYRIVGPKGVELYNREVASAVVGGPHNLPIKGPSGEELHCLGAGEFTLPADLAPGRYALRVSEVNDRFNEEKRTFAVKRRQQPRFHKVVQFHRRSYGAGDLVKMQVRVVPIQGLPIDSRDNLSITARVFVDGKEKLSQNVNIDSQGRAALEFTLPDQIHKGVGTVTIECNDAGVKEALTRDIPLIVRNLQVEFYPEGGDLIADVQNRVYFQARTPAGKPADLTGRIVDDKNAEAARVQTLTDDQAPGINQGLGVFTFVPELGRRYRLAVDSPIGIERAFPLPAAKESGVIMTTPEAVAGHEIHVDLMSVKERRVLLVGAYCRGRLLDYKVVRAGVDQPVHVALRPNLDVAGVYRITVFEMGGTPQDISFRPLAERLIYRKSAARVDVAVKSDRPSYQPGDKVRLTLEAKNENKAFVPALATIAVVDSSVLQWADEKTARGMPTHFLLTTEVRDPEDLEDADFLLGDHPRAALALDLLLGSQGWRRFAEQNPKEFQDKQRTAQRVQEKEADVGNPNFLTNTAVVTQLLDNEQKGIDKLDRRYVKKAVAMQEKLAAVESKEAGPANLKLAVAARESEVQKVDSEVATAASRLRAVRVFLIQFGLGGILLALLAAGFCLISVGLRRLTEGTGKPRRWFTAGLGLLALLFSLSVVGTFAFMGKEPFEDFRVDGGFKLGLGMGMPPRALNQQPNLPEPDGLVVADEPLVEDLKKANDKADAADKALVQGPQEQKLKLPQPQLNRNANDALNNNEALLAQMEPQDQERLLRQQGNYQAILLKQLGRRVQLPAAHDPSVVRIYAHKHEPREDGVRDDHAPTIYWNPVVVMPDGKAEVTFDLSDSVTRFQVLVHSNTFDGRLGASSADVVSKLPFAFETNVPAEVSDKDRIALGLKIHNDLAKETSVSLSARVKGLQVLNESERRLTLPPKAAKGETFDIRPALSAGNATLRIVGKANGLTGAIERRFQVVPDGYPVAGSFSGVLENGAVEHEITLPETMIPGSLKVQAHLYPSFLAELQGAQIDLLRGQAAFEPGLARQVPNLMILQFMSAHPEQANPILEKRVRQALRSALPKQAVIEFADLPYLKELARFYADEPDLLQRTQQFLLDQRDGKGGFKRVLGRGPDPLTDAYLLWALTESGMTHGLDKELAALREQAKTRKDPYFLALAALSHLNCKKEDEGIALLRQLRGFQKDTGAVSSARGRDLDVETTALAVLGWVKADRPWLVPEFTKNTPNTVHWLSQQRRGDGGYGSPQATAFALRALLAYQEKHPHNVSGGDASLIARQIQPGNAPPLAGASPGDSSDSGRGTLSARSQDVLTLTLQSAATLKPGKQIIALNLTGDNSLPYTLSWSYRAAKVVNDPKTPVKLATNLDRRDAKENDTIKLTATLENTSGKAQGTTVAVLGLPAGLTIPEGAAQLKALQAAGKFAAWELHGRELALTWRELAAGAKVEVELVLTCRFPGEYRGPASSVYTQADAGRRCFVEPLNIRIGLRK